MLKSIISDYEAASKSFCGYQGKLDWLKSLRYKKQWKPSEEPMKALRDLNLTGNISYAGQG